MGEKWRYWERNEDIGRELKIFGEIWRYWERNGDIWREMEILGEK